MLSAAEVLADLPPKRRIAAASEVILLNPGMSVEERCEVLSVALWPLQTAEMGSTIAADRAARRGCV